MPNDDAAVRFMLRRGTADCHARVDAAFSRYDLGNGASYRAFLIAHARVLLPLEAGLDAVALWPEWRERGDLLRADLGALGCDVPDALAVGVPGDAAARWGMLYVIEGSRLGGAMLARRVGAGLPVAYLAAGHRGGSWARFGVAIDAAARDDAAWQDAALGGAERAFGMFEASVGS